MGKPSIFAKIREWIGGVAFAVLLWSARMTEEEYYAEQERAAQQSMQTDNLATTAACPICGRDPAHHDMYCDNHPHNAKTAASVNG